MLWTPPRDPSLPASTRKFPLPRLNNASHSNTLLSSSAKKETPKAAAAAAKPKAKAAAAEPKKAKKPAKPRPARRPKKTIEELDAEMADYFDKKE